MFLNNKKKDFASGPMAKSALGLHCNARGLGSIPGQDTRSHMPQLTPKAPHTAPKTQFNQKKKKKLNKYKILKV